MTISPPQQTRSQQTLENILKAATELLEEKSFEEMTINDIVTAANCSVGAFYGRFKDKDALLFALDEHFVDRYVAGGNAWVEEQQSNPAADLTETVNSLMNSLYQMHQTNLGLLRTIILRVRLYPDRRFREQETRINQIVPKITTVLLKHRAEIKHPNPELAVVFGFLQAFLAMRETLAWPHIRETMPIMGEAYASELAKIYLAYLKTGE